MLVVPVDVDRVGGAAYRCASCIGCIGRVSGGGTLRVLACYVRREQGSTHDGAAREVGERYHEHEREDVCVRFVEDQQANYRGLLTCSSSCLAEQKFIFV